MISKPAQSSDDTRSVIIERLGFFPPFFEPALQAPAVLLALWRQAEAAYLDSPLPRGFRERLGEALSNFEFTPYTCDRVEAELRKLAPESLSDWPEENSELENSIYHLALAVFRSEESESCRQALRKLLPAACYLYLETFLSFKRTAFEWIEAHPEINAHNLLLERPLERGLPEEARGLASFFDSGAEHDLIRHLKQHESLKAEGKRMTLLQEAETARQELTSFFMQAPAPIAILTGSEHVFTLANPLFATFVGCDPHGKTLREVFQGQELDQFETILHEVYVTGKPFDGREIEFKREHGSHRGGDLFVNVNCHPFRDTAGKTKGILVFCQEVTEQIQARNAIKESERYFRSLSETLPQIIWTASRRGRISYVNSRWREYTGSTQPSEWQKFIHPEDMPQVKAAWERSMQFTAPHQLDVRIRGRGGKYRWFLTRAVPLKDGDGNFSGWCGSATDIEESKIQAKELSDAKSEAERANATKSAFLANMSHEIRTPLGAILGFTELLRDPSTQEEERRGYLDIIIRNGKALTRVIDDILDLSKVEAGHLQIERVAFNLPEILSEITSLFGETVKAKNLYLTLAIDSNVPSRVLSDPARLRQILINIIGNAVKFTSQGGIKVKVQAEPVEASGEKSKIIISVADTGPGLLRSQQKKLFQPFTQADNTTTRKYGGTGLGLALSRRLAQAMGGNIAISECKLRRGCTFQITLEVEHPHEPALQLDRIGRVAPAPLSVLSSANVLVVEDAIDNQILIKRILARQGAKVDIANNGEEGVQKALAGSYSIILMDIQMPVMDGYEAIKKLRSSGYRGTVYALTAHAMAEERKKTQSAGYDGHLTKPLDTEILIQTIRQHLH